MTRRRSGFFALVLVPALLMAGCEAGVAPIAGTTLSTEWTFPDSGITLSPPGTATPTLTADAAYDLCRTHVADCAPDAPTAVLLALLTDTGSNIVAKDTLVWAISWLGTTSCLPGNNGNPGDGYPLVGTPSAAALDSPAVTPHQVCDKIAFVDARSATFYFTYETFHYTN